MYVTASKAEYESILQGNYRYDKSVVKLIGFPRYDSLIDESNNIITIMPTWRKKLAREINYTTHIREYNNDFKKSEYFQSYNNLINDTKLLDKMRECGYRGQFVIHPSHIENARDFKGNDVF